MSDPTRVINQWNKYYEETTPEFKADFEAFIAKYDVHPQDKSDIVGDVPNAAHIWFYRTVPDEGYEPDTIDMACGPWIQMLAHVMLVNIPLDKRRELMAERDAALVG